MMKKQATDKQKTIVLYHGSIHLFDEIDVSSGKPFKDFGIGFYTSKSEEHAKNLALRNKSLEITRRRKIGANIDTKAWLYAYEFDLVNLGNLSVKEFCGADQEWMRFVVLNRINENKQHSYDVVIGPTANDNTRVTIRLFFAGAYGDIKSDRAINMLIDQIEADKLPSQFYFGSNKAAKLLSFQGRRMIK
jgi:hypothetical protein